MIWQCRYKLLTNGFQLHNKHVLPSFTATGSRRRRIPIKIRKSTNGMRTSQATTNCNTRIKHSHSCVGSPLKTDIFETSKRSPLSWGQSHMLGEELHQCNEKTLEQGLPGCVSWRWSSSTEEDEVAAQTPSSSQLEWSSKSASVVRERLNHIAFTAKCSQKYVRYLRKDPFSAGNSISAHLSCLHKRWWSLFGEDRSENGRRHLLPRVK